MDTTPAHRSDPPYLDIAIVVRKALQLIGERPVALLGSVTLAYVPLTVLLGGAGGGLFLLLGRRGMSNDVEAVFSALTGRWPWLVLLVVTVLVAVLVSSACVEACVVMIAGDAYAGRASTVGGTLRAVYAVALRAIATRFVTALGTLPMIALAALSVGVTWALALEGTVAALVSVGGILVAALAFVAYWTLAALAIPAALFEDVGPVRALRRAFVRTAGVRVYVGLTWLVAWLGVFVASCLLGCGANAGMIPLQLALGEGTSQAVSAVVGQLLNIPLYVFLHAVGAITYGELTGKSVAKTADVAEVFR